MLKVAIVGCGKIADSHASQIQRIAGCEIVGVCDREPLMAQQLYKRFPIKQCFSDLPELLKRSKARCRPHHDAAAEPFRNCEDLSGMGSHAYVEKPFTIWEDEARRLMGSPLKKV